MSDMIETTVDILARHEQARIAREAEALAERMAYVNGLRALADYLETTTMNFKYEFGLRVDTWAYNEEDFAMQSRLLGGKRDKVLEGSYAITRRNFGPHFIDVNISRENVCERVQVGVKTIPAQEAKPARIEPEYEWQCEGFTVTK